MPLIIAVAILLLCPNSGRAQTRGATPQPLGELVDVGGYRVHIYCIGTGSPAVVITGAGFSFDWGLVQPDVAKFTRVCAYDHSGTGWSDPGPVDTCSLRVGEIHAALSKAHIPGPYVLVGHSLGAYVSRLYASTYPNQVAGLVIVDHAFSPGMFRMPAPPMVSGTGPPGPFRTKEDIASAFQKLPARDYQLHLWASSLPASSRIMARNVAMAPECAAEVERVSRANAQTLAAKPLIVLSQPFSPAELQAQLLSMSSNNKQIVAENSGHYIMIDRPDIVITAIRDVVAAARNHTNVNK
jgi:pimeloyl-ACP methyl ester carboxylesterase